MHKARAMRHVGHRGQQSSQAVHQIKPGYRPARCGKKYVLGSLYPLQVRHENESKASRLEYTLKFAQGERHLMRYEMLQSMTAVDGIKLANLTHVGHAGEDVRLMVRRHIQPDFLILANCPFRHWLATATNVQQRAKAHIKRRLSTSPDRPA